VHILDKEAEMDDYKKGILVAMQHRLQERVKSNCGAYGLCCDFLYVMKQEGVHENSYLFFKELFRSELLNAQANYHSPGYWWPISDYEVRREFLQTLLDND